MRKLRVFRPTHFDHLEDRAVPSQGGAPVLFEPNFAIPAEVANLKQVRVAFATFLADYLKAVDQVLLAPGPDGSVNPAQNRVAFNQQVDLALSELDTTVVAAVSSAKLPNSQTVIGDVQEAIVGDVPESLATRLAALPTPAATPATGSLTQAIASPNDIEQAAREILGTLQGPTRGNAVPSGTELNGLSFVSADDAAAATASATSAAVAAHVRQAYSAFLQGYFRAVQQVLMAPGADGSINPAANRAAFDAQVAASLKALNNGVASAVSNIPQAAAVAAKTQQVLVGGGADSLEAQLRALPTPTSRSSRHQRLRLQFHQGDRQLSGTPDGRHRLLRQRHRARPLTPADRCFDRRVRSLHVSGPTHFPGSGRLATIA